MPSSNRHFSMCLKIHIDFGLWFPLSWKIKNKKTTAITNLISCKNQYLEDTTLATVRTYKKQVLKICKDLLFLVYFSRSKTDTVKS